MGEELETLPFDLCTCGRLRIKPHCTLCGSYQVNAYARKETVHRGMHKIEHIRSYRCRICGQILNDDDRANCKAPPRQGGTGKPPKKEKAPAVEYDRLEDAPPVLVERVKEIQRLKREGKW